MQRTTVVTGTDHLVLQNTSNRKHLNNLKSAFVSPYWVHLTTDCIVIGYFFKLVFLVFVRCTNVK